MVRRDPTGGRRPGGRCGTIRAGRTEPTAHQQGHGETEASPEPATGSRARRYGAHGGEHKPTAASVVGAATGPPGRAGPGTGRPPGAPRPWSGCVPYARRMGVSRAIRVRLTCVPAAVAALVLLSIPLVGTVIGPARPASASLFAGGGVRGFGDAATYGSFAGLTLASPAVAMASTPDGRGYWVTADDGGVFSFGDAGFYGSTGGTALDAPVVGMAATHDGHGYWLVALDGGVFSFGDAPFYGSTGDIRFNQPVVGMAATPDGRGYWLVASDGGIFSFGDAPFYGSTGDIRLNRPVVGMAATPDGRGYWLVASDGGIFSFGDAPFYGSAAGADIGTSVTGIAPTHDGRGYWLVAATAGVLPFGDATYLGPSPTTPRSTHPGHRRHPGRTRVLAPATGRHRHRVHRSVSRRRTRHRPVGRGPGGPGPGRGPGGVLQSVRALRGVVRAVRHLGVGHPGHPRPPVRFTGDVFDWGAARGLAVGPATVPAAGDAVLFGTGPYSTATSTHMGIVAQVWPDGAIISIEGDAGPEPRDGSR